MVTVVLRQVKGAEKIKTHDQQGNLIMVEAMDTPVEALQYSPVYDHMPVDTMYSPIVLPSKDGTPRIGLIDPSIIATSREVTQEILRLVDEARRPIVEENNRIDTLQQQELVRLNSVINTQNSEITRLNSLSQTQAGEITRLNNVSNTQTNEISRLNTVANTQATEIARLNTVNNTQTTEINRLNSVETTQNAMITELQKRPLLVALPDGVLTYSTAIALGAGSRSVTFNCTGVLTTDRLIVQPKAALPLGYNTGPSVCLTNGVVTTQVTYPALALGASFSIPVAVWAIR